MACQLIETERDPMMQGTELDLLEALCLPQQQPIMFFCMVIEPRVQLTKLRRAISCCGKLIPELNARYDRLHHCWIPLTSDDAEVLREVSEFAYDSWNVEKDAQWFIQLKHEGLQDRLCIGISHILCDGKGACQLLKVLWNCYREGKIEEFENVRILADWPCKIGRKRISKRKKEYLLKKEAKNGSTYDKVLLKTVSLSEVDLCAKQYGWTINDILLAAFSQVIHEVFHIDHVTLPCPVNLRAFLIDEPEYTITNFTGEYHVTLDFTEIRTFTQLVDDVHLQMKEEQKCNVDLTLIHRLHHITKILPLSVMRWMATRYYDVPDVSFTNVGVLKQDAFHLDDAEVVQVYAVTKKRRFPSFQLSVSTFRDCCTLSAHVNGTPEELELAEQMIRRVKELLELWSKER